MRTVKNRSQRGGQLSPLKEFDILFAPVSEQNQLSGAWCMMCSLSARKPQTGAGPINRNGVPA